MGHGGDDLLDPFFLVLVRDCDVSTTGLEVDGDLVAEHLVFNREAFENDILNVIVPVHVSDVSFKRPGLSLTWPTQECGRTLRQHPPYLAERPSCVISSCRKHQ